jgi:hypothetical protein
MLSFKKLTWKKWLCGCGRCLIEFLDWGYSQSCWYFRPSFVNYAPLTFSLVHLLPPSLCQSTVHTDSVWLGYRVALPPKQKLRRERGLRQINTCRKVPLEINFFNIWHCISLIFLRFEPCGLLLAWVRSLSVLDSSRSSEATNLMIWSFHSRTYSAS